MANCTPHPLRPTATDKDKEPKWESTPCTQYALIHALNWYTENKNEKDARKYLIAHLGSQIPAAQKSAAESFNNSYNISDGWFARCLDRGCIAPEVSVAGFKDRLNEFLERVSAFAATRDVKAAKTVDVISLQERIQSKSDYFIMELEGAFDEYFFNKKKPIDVYKWLNDNDVKPVHAGKIAEYFRARASEFVKIMEDSRKDDYVAESYPRSKKEMVVAATFFANIAKDADRIGSNMLSQRKPRKTKSVTAEKRVAGLKYKAEDSDFKLSSVNPTGIIGANQLWVFNTKTRKLATYIARDEAGLMVKGSCIENFNTTESIAKTVRKPQEILPKVLDGGKIVLRKLMGDINSKASNLNGRINKDTILLRVSKS